MFGKLLVADLKMIARNKQSLWWALLFPIVFATIFGLFNFGEIEPAEVAVVGETPAVQRFQGAVEQTSALTLRTDYTDESVARTALGDGQVDFVLVVRGDDVQVLYDETQADRNSVFLPVMRQIVDQMNLVETGTEPRYDLAIVGVGGRSIQYYDFVLPGLVGMAVMSYGIIGLGSTVAQYRGQRILRRILATPLRPATFIGAIVVAHLLLAIVQSSLVLAFGVLVFDGTVRGNLGIIFLIVALGNLTFLNIGFMVAARAETAEAASGLGNMVAMPMMFFSGVFFPTASLPWLLPAITRLLPLRPMVDAIRDVAVNGAGLGAQVPEMAQLAAWAAVTFVIASRVFRFSRA